MQGGKGLGFDSHKVIKLASMPIWSNMPTNLLAPDVHSKKLSIDNSGLNSQKVAQLGTLLIRIELASF